MTIYFNSVEDLEKLPERTVVIDTFGDVYQRLNGFWFTPADSVGARSIFIGLPARLLDDGLP